MEDNNSGTKTVLLIEDDPDLAELISEYLGMNYYEVQHAPTATTRQLHLGWQLCLFICC